MNRSKFAVLLAFAVLLLATPAWALTLDDIKEMHTVGVPDNIIISTIGNSEDVFNLTSAEIVELKKLGISDNVISALQQTSGSVTRSEGTTREDEPRVRDRERDEDSRPSSRDRDRDEDSRSSSRDRDEDSRPSSRDRDRDEDSRSSSRDRDRDEEPTSRRRRRDDDGDDSLLRRRRSRRGGDEDQSSNRSSRSKVRRTPKEIKKVAALHKEKKTLTASKTAWDLLESGKFPEPENVAKLNYYLGSSLKDMGMLHAAQVHFQAVVKEGPSIGSSFAASLSKMVDISEVTHDPIYLIRTIDKIDPDDYPGKVKDDLYYFQGVRDFERKEYARAMRNFAKLGKSSSHYAQARYHLGVIYNIQDRKKAALKTFTRIVNGSFDMDPGELSALKQLSLVNIARIRYGVEQYTRSAERYAQMRRGTTHWPTSLYESAWAHFMSENKEKRALGNLLTLQSPFFDRVWLPEAAILEALTFYRICEYQQVEALLDGFKAKYSPIQKNVADMLQPYKDGERPLRDLYQRLYGSKGKDHKQLPVAVFAKIEANRSFAGPHNRVLQIESELAAIQGQKPQWRDAEVGKGVKELLKTQRTIYMKFAGAALATELGKVNDQLGDLMGQEALIRFEVVSGEYQKYADRFRNPDSSDVDESVEFDFATNPDVIFWPFNEEYWEDELGYYERIEPGDCKE